MKKNLIYCLFIFIMLSSFAYKSCAGMAVPAEEYFALGMAFFELGRFEEAERWLNRARQADRTMTASQYNLGRIAFETRRFNDAARHFETILRRDPDNVLALRAAAYTRIRTGDLGLAERHYRRLLQLIPESADDGYNHALVLFAMERFYEAEEVLQRHPFAILDNFDVLLMYARIQGALNRVEAIDHYARWLEFNTDQRVRFEFAQLLEQHEFYSRAVDEYRLVVSELTEASTDPRRYDVRFALARLLLIADSESPAGITELETAVSEGFNDIRAVEEVLNDPLVSAANRVSLRNIINNMQHTAGLGDERLTEQEEIQEPFDQWEETFWDEQLESYPDYGAY